MRVKALLAGILRAATVRSKMNTGSQKPRLSPCLKGGPRRVRCDQALAFSNKPNMQNLLHLLAKLFKSLPPHTHTHPSFFATYIATGGRGGRGRAHTHRSQPASVSRCTRRSLSLPGSTTKGCLPSFLLAILPRPCKCRLELPLRARPIGIGPQELECGDVPGTSPSPPIAFSSLINIRRLEEGNSLSRPEKGRGWLNGGNPGVLSDRRTAL